MSEVTQEAERWRPGVCHHEAAHAVFAYHADQPIKYITVGEDEAEVMSRIRYRRGDSVTTALVMSGMLAGKYAQELATTGKERDTSPSRISTSALKRHGEPASPPRASSVGR